MTEKSNPRLGFVHTFYNIYYVYFLMLIVMLNIMLIVYDSSLKIYQDGQGLQSNTLIDAVSSGIGIEDNLQSDMNTDQSISSMNQINYGINKGNFDVTAVGNQLTLLDDVLFIKVKGNLAGFFYKDEDINRIIEWIESKKEQKINIEVNNSQVGIPLSDSLRLAYEQGILLMKSIKSYHSEIELNLNISSVTDNSESEIILTLNK